MTTVFVNICIMIGTMFCGWGLVKARKAVSDHAKSISGILIYLCGPCMVLNAFQSLPYDAGFFGKAMLFFGVALTVMVVFYLLMALLFRKKLDNPKYRVLTVASILGNVGYFGLPVITGLFPDQPIVACYSIMYTAAMNILLFTLGVFMLTRDRKYISFKDALLNPATLATIISIPLYLLRVQFPGSIADIVALLGKMTTPLCMIVLGMRLASMEFVHTFTRGFAYIACAMKLIVYPLFAYACVYFIPGLDDVFKSSLCILSATPTAALLLSLAEQHECERKICASVLLISAIACVLTIPLLVWITG